MTKFFPLITLLFTGILYLKDSTHVLAGLMIFLIQIIALAFIKWLINKCKERDIQFLVPVFRLFDFFFAVGFTVWIGLAVFGQMTTIIGRVYTLLGIIVFLSLLIVITNRIYIDSDLLDAYIKDKKEGDKDDR